MCRDHPWHSSSDGPRAYVGEFRSNQIGVFTGSAIILVIAYFTIRWIGAKRTLELLTVGFTWLVLTMAFEVLFGRFVMGLSWERLGADYNLLNGGLMPLGLMVMLFSPMVAAKLRAKGSEFTRYLAKQMTCFRRTSTQQPHHPPLPQRLPAPLASDRDTWSPGV